MPSTLIAPWISKKRPSKGNSFLSIAKVFPTRESYAFRVTIPPGRACPRSVGAQFAACL